MKVIKEHVAPLVGAWIEIHINTAFQVYMLSLPSWERGLKYCSINIIYEVCGRSPRGSVD